MRTVLNLIASIGVVFAAGCTPEAPVKIPSFNALLSVDAATDPPTQEWFIGLPRGLPIEVGDAVRTQVEKSIEEAPPGACLTFFLADNQELLGTLEIPAGSKAYRRKIARRELKLVYERLDPEMSGGSQAVDLISIPATIRKYRKTELPPRVILIGSPLIEDRERQNSITTETIPCDGCVLDGESSYGRMASFPAQTTLRWHSVRAEWGNGPNHRAQVEHFLRYLLKVKQGPLIRMSSDASVVFTSDDAQWDDEVAPQDDCQGQKKVTADAKTTLFDQDGKTEVVVLKPDLAIKVRRPESKWLKGPLTRVLFLPDTSGSVVINANGADCRQIFTAIQTDLCDKLKSMPCEQFAICGFGGDANLQARLSKHPSSLLSALYWADATPENRAAAIEFVKGLQAGGGTPTHAALAEALRLEGPLTCILYSDGVPTLIGGQAEVLELAKTLALRKITVNTVGVGALSVHDPNFDWSGAEFLARLAQRTHGEYFSLE